MCIAAAGFAFPVYAAEAVLPIRATIVQCGPKKELAQACERDARCCGLLGAAHDQ